MNPVAGNLIAIAAVIALVAVSLRQIIKDTKGGGCAGCSGGCASCGGSCSPEMKKKNGISETKAAEILDSIDKPKRLVTSEKEQRND